MGTYMLGTKEIIDELDDVLDNMEGDFTNKQLLDVLEVLKLYPFVCDVHKKPSEYLNAKEKLE